MSLNGRSNLSAYQPAQARFIFGCSHPHRWNTLRDSLVVLPVKLTSTGPDNRESAHPPQHESRYCCCGRPVDCCCGWPQRQLLELLFHEPPRSRNGASQLRRLRRERRNLIRRCNSPRVSKGAITKIDCHCLRESFISIELRIL